MKPGFAYGASDEVGYHVAENPVSIYDFHATVLYLLGLDFWPLLLRSQFRSHTEVMAVVWALTSGLMAILVVMAVVSIRLMRRAHARHVRG